MKNSRQSVWIILFILVSISAAFAVYYNALWNEFIWDDHIVLKNQLGAFRSAQDIFFPPEGIQQLSLHYYRPLVILSYLVDEAIWGEAPFGFHFTVILLHVLNTIIVFFISRMILTGFQNGDVGALLAALVFAVHPIHTESVAWMAGRSDVLAAVFFFLALFFYLKFKKSNKGLWLILSPILFLLAAFGKETSLSMILLLPFIDVAFSSPKEIVVEKNVRRSAPKKTESWMQAVNIYGYIPFLLAMIIYFWVRHYALQGGIQKSLQTSHFSEIPKVLVNSYGFYFKKLLLPINLMAVIHEVPSDFWTTIINMVIFAALLTGVIISFTKKYWIVFFSIIFFIFTLIPSILVAVLEISETPLAERYLYIPSFSFSLIIAFVLLSLSVKLAKSVKTAAVARVTPILLALFLLVIFSFQTVNRNKVWRNDIPFWSDLVDKAPDKGYAHLQLGIAFSRKGRTEEAVVEYEKVVKSSLDAETRAITLNNLGNIYSVRGDHDRAEQYFKEAITIWKDYPAPYYNLALSHWKKILKDSEKGKAYEIRLVEEAIEHLNLAVQMNPQYTQAQCLLGELLYRMGRYEEARKHLEMVIKYEYDKEKIIVKVAKQWLDKIPTQ